MAFNFQLGVDQHTIDRDPQHDSESNLNFEDVDHLFVSFNNILLRKLLTNFRLILKLSHHRGMPDNLYLTLVSCVANTKKLSLATYFA